MPTFFAHSGSSPDLHRDGQPLRDHLTAVAELARGLARTACPADRSLAEAAYRAGLLHDLGKYQAAWQQYLKDAAAGRPATSVPHAIYGAAHAAYTLGHEGIALAVAGHHAGLPDFPQLSNNLIANSDTLGAALAGLLPAARQELPELPEEEVPPPFSGDGPGDLRRYEFWTRVLFSALVDADRLETERFCTGDLRPSAPLDPGELLDRLDRVRRRRAAQRPTDALTVLRNQVFDECVRQGRARPQGFFELTVPTGGAKTLAAMAFALAHARRHGLRRVIVVIPYLSIIEQNAREYIQAFGPGVVVEHHSAVAESGPVPEEQTKRAPGQLATENWDAPVIVTTSVQFLESLLAASPRRCRKLHNVAGSVVVFDEAQALPAHILNPLLSVFRELIDRYRVSIVFSTATQPAFRKNPNLPEGLRPEELAPILPLELRDRLFQSLRRVHYHVELNPPWDWESLVGRLAERKQGLCVLNTRAHARTVWERLRQRVAQVGAGGLQSAVVHLSSAMCAQHRLDVLGTRDAAPPGSVHDRLKRGQPCWLVSTQVIEAGVDVDFPRVFRALGPLDAIVQVAGRCNREGLLKDEATGQPRRGDVFIFQPAEEGMPPGFYQLATGLTRTLLGGEMTDDQLATDPEVFASYFDALFNRSSTDARGKGEKPVQELRTELRFREVAERARVIADGGTPVLVPYGQSVALLQQIRKAGSYTRNELRSLQRYTVNLRARDLATLQTFGQLTPLLDGDPEGPQVLDAASYHPSLGVLVNGQAAQDLLIV